MNQPGCVKGMLRVLLAGALLCTACSGSAAQRGGLAVLNPLPEFTDVLLHTDARPMIVVNMQNGEGWNSAKYLNNGADADGNGVPDGFDELVRDRLDTAYADGWRRILLNRTTGDLSIQWHEMADWQHAGYLGAVRAWADAHPEVALEAYVRLDDIPASFGFGDDQAVLDGLMAELAPWRDSGFGVVWIDGGMVELSTWERINRTHLLTDEATGRRTIIGCEASSIVVRSRDGELPSMAVPWIALSQNPFWDFLRDGPLTVIDRQARSAGFWVHIDPVESIDYMYRLMRTGKWIVAHDDAGQRTGWKQRLYEFGVVEKPADIDANGVLDVNDVIYFAVQFSDNDSDAADPLFYEGDYDRSGAVDVGDVVSFVNDFTAGGGSPIDFGASRQPPMWSN